MSKNTSVARTNPEHPWHLATNERYREVVKATMALATGALILPVFYLRDVLRIPNDQSLAQSLDWRVYVSWGSLASTVTAGLVFHYASAKWARIAWGVEAKFWGYDAGETAVERVLDASFWCTLATFVLGIILILWYVATFVPQPA